MASPTDQTIAVSFKNVPFKVRTENRESGRKVAVHEYPGSNVRFVEDLGELPDTFRINGFVDGPTYLTEATRLRNVLKEKTEGVLETSSWGIIKVKSQIFTETVNQTSVGEIYFNITFLRSKANPSPVVVAGTVETVSTSANDLLVDTQDNFEEAFVAPTTAGTIQTATYEGTQAIEAIETASDSIQAEGMQSLINTALADINTLIKSPEDYAAALFNDGLLGALFENLPLDGTALPAMTKLTKFGNSLATDSFSINNNTKTVPISDYDIPLFSETTVIREKANANRKTLVNNVRLASLGMLCEQAARADYGTDDDINSIKATIDEAYTAIVLTDDVDATIGNSLDEVRLGALEVLDQKLQSTPNLVNYSVRGRTTNMLLAYLLYAEQFTTENELDERGTVLSDLNGLLPTKLKGDISVLEVQT